ncbi:MAG TPA: DUF2652 domain-containing protein [Candidatus Limnocylindrales bacterium]|nr:DUF2652 domain-containing protein [Candidatus Limnocylindrales bacterium]
MLSQPEPACLVIADISGYTGFLAGAELDHAQDILADLMSTVVAAFRPTFKLAKLEGDAAFVYVRAPTVDAAALQDTIERCYFAFRRRLRDVSQASTCECNACILVPRLDLKVVAHHGLIVRQRIGGWEELVGSDVIIVHRLLKNHVQESLGVEAYAAYTDACVSAMGLADPAAAGLGESVEPFEGVGEIRMWVRDLHAAWDAETARARRVVAGDEVAMVLEATPRAPAALVWDYMTSPIRRPKWQAGVDDVVESASTAGRRGIGTVNHCIHGKDAIVEEVLDWEPYDHVTYRTQLPIPNTPKLLSSYVFRELDDGRTHVELRFGRPKSAKDRAITEPLMPMIRGMFEAGAAELIPIVEAAARDAEAAAPPEPEVPVALGRNLREPIATGR